MSSLVVSHPFEQSAHITHIFGDRSFFHSSAFSMSSITLPYFWQSAMYSNSIAKNSSVALTFASFNCPAVGSVTPYSFSIALVHCSVCPMPSPSWLYTCLMSELVVEILHQLPSFLSHLKQADCRHDLLMDSVQLLTTI